ncbi:MAG: 6-phosphogluconolactonase, partial [Novosphingobium sp.]
MADVRIIDDKDDAEIADWLARRLSAALHQAQGTIAITLPGGSTPFPILARLVAGHPALDWSRIVIWPGDDRCVAEDHPASNVGRIRGMLEPAGAHIVPLVEGAHPPHFALAWLGMGSDGHIASLFPSADPQADDPPGVRRLIPDPLPPEAPFARLTLAMADLLASDALLFVARGPEKRALFAEAARGGNDLPVARLLASARQP